MSAIARPGPIYQRMSRKIMDALHPTSLVIRDDTHLHASHAQSPGLPETHFNVDIVSSAFEGQSLVARQRRIYTLLAEEMSERIHALSMTTRTPTEVAARAGAKQ